ncbi:hypothetical protein A3Q56_07607 [Intoshia linei]|uniref:Uncharacterized protein n=1 Tax=Intoshia linei TaxID=1819745 RepID=A0A177ARQ5_9BILA|nr:hypothetical protein A3Q56_07607 [Intoshia linei]
MNYDKYWLDNFNHVASGSAPSEYKISNSKVGRTTKRSMAHIISLDDIKKKINEKAIQSSKVHGKPELEKTRPVFGVESFHYFVSDYFTNIAENLFPKIHFDLNEKTMTALRSMTTRSQQCSRE